MIEGTIGGDIALVLGALGIFIASVVGTFITYRSSKVTRDTHAQVVTFNESTMGQLAAADETRRIEHILHDQRTAQEQRHIDSAPPDEPPQSSSRIADRIVHVDKAVDAIQHAVDDQQPDSPSLYELVVELSHKFDLFLAAASTRAERVEDALGLLPPPPPRPPTRD